MWNKNLELWKIKSKLWENSQWSSFFCACVSEISVHRMPSFLQCSFNKRSGQTLKSESQNPTFHNISPLRKNKDTPELKQRMHLIKRVYKSTVWPEMNQLRGIRTKDPVNIERKATKDHQATPKNCVRDMWRNHKLPSSTFKWIAAICMKTRRPRQTATFGN